VSASQRPYACHIVFFLLLVGLGALVARLLTFQTRCQADMIHKAEVQQRIPIDIPGRRGDIYGRSYAMPVLLAGSRQAPGVFADPMFIQSDQVEQVAAAVAEALRRPAKEVRQDFEEARQSNRHFIWLARDVDDQTVARVKSLRIRAVDIRPEWRREYPNGALAAHVVGFASREDAGVEKGMEGMELYADSYLRAENGRNIVWGDAARRAIWDAPDAYQAPVDGHHVQLTLDVVIQRNLEEKLAEAVSKSSAESGIGVVVDVRNGEILAMASEPSYDLNSYGKASADELRNRAITDPYEPGSVFKPFVASAALALGKVHLGEEIFCNNGAFVCRPGRTLHDVHGGYGTLTFEAIVFKSSNIGMAHIGERLGNEALYKILNAYGFGQLSGIELRGEDAGIVNPLKNWTPDTKYSVPMGQEVGVTGVQLAIGFAAIANDGLLLRPKLIRAIYSADGAVQVDRAGPMPLRQVIDAKVCREFRLNVLAKVPTEGTGKAGKLSGWSSFGKTGTAQIAPYGTGKYTASYMAGAPVDKPRLVCLISVRKPDPSGGRYYGGQVAAPVVKAVLEQALAYLDVPCDEQVAPAAGVHEAHR
jgi:cell division protein FtsI/penicillin-binding protein 2